MIDQRYAMDLMRQNTFDEGKEINGSVFCCCGKTVSSELEIYSDIIHACRSVAKGGPGGARAPPSVAKVGPGPPTFLRLCPYFAFDTRLAESAVARLAISTRMAIPLRLSSSTSVCCK